MALCVCVCVCVMQIIYRVAVSMNHYRKVAIGGNSAEGDDEIVYRSSSDHIVCVCVCVCVCACVCTQVCMSACRHSFVHVVL